MGLVLDSSIAIAAERRGDDVPQMLRWVSAIAGDQKAALSSVELTELVHGVFRAQTPQVRIRRETFIQELILNVDVHSYTKETALLAGKIDGEQQSKGIVIPFPDLLIGATALEIGYAIATANPRHFRLIPSLTVIPL